MTKVLVVDDDATVREVVSRYLRRDGHEVLERADGVQGLAAALTEHPDLVVLDVMMPGMDGLAVCRELRRRSTVPVIMLTALSEESDGWSGSNTAQTTTDQAVQPARTRSAGRRRSAAVPTGTSCCRRRHATGRRASLVRRRPSAWTGQRGR